VRVVSGAGPESDGRVSRVWETAVINRRQMFRALLGTPLAVAAGAAVVPSVREVVVAPGSVSVDLRVHDRGEGRVFTMTLFQEPWPLAGDRVRFDYQTLHLVGVVEQTEAVPLFTGQSDRFLYHVNGRVLEFTGQGAV
jgi:hypothetical protein